MTSSLIRKQLVPYTHNGMLRFSFSTAVLLACVLFCLNAACGQQGAGTAAAPAARQSRTQAPQQNLPKTWVDKDTGHRVTRVTDEPGSSALYFNFDAYTPDGRQMVYSSPAGISMLDLATGKTRVLVANAPPASNSATSAQPRGGQRILAVGRKTGAVYFSRMSPEGLSEVYSADITTGAVRKLVTLPPRATVVTINADETLASGTYEVGDHTAEDYGNNRAAPVPPGQPNGKGQMMARRLATHIPMVLFVIDLKTGKVKELLHSTDWINHMLFSPVDPTLLMYCHEGPWQLVDRIWLIRTDGTQNTLVHKRTMFMEISGHEFWSRDGKTIWYDWQLPKGRTYFFAGYEIATHHRDAYSLTPNQWSIHFNGSNNPTMFAGDGGDSGQVTQAPDGTWIELYHTDTSGRRDGVNSPDLIQPGILNNEHLVNMANQNYMSEPNERFSPDDKRIFFTSNMFGPNYVFSVEVDKAPASATDVFSTPELAQRFKPKPPPTPYDEQW
ncbi:MAG: oligogalacturonate lyase family protein [Acidobacteriaceae bacterium]